MINKTYPFSKLRETWSIRGAYALALGVFSAVAAAFYSPVLLTVAGGYGVIRAVLETPPPFLRRWKLKRSLANRELRKLPSYHLAQYYAEVAAKKLGMERKPEVFAVKDAEDDEFSVFPGSGIILAPDREAMRDRSSGFFSFVLAHEVAHDKVDDSMLRSLCVNTLEYGGQALSYFGLAVIVISMIPNAAPYFLNQGIFAAPAFLGTLAARGGVALALRYASRVAEYRADRNALYATRSLGNALSVMSGFELDLRIERQKGHFHLPEVLSTHPTPTNRKKALCAAFNEIAKYPEVSVALPKKPKGPKGPKPL